MKILLLLMLCFFGLGSVPVEGKTVVYSDKYRKKILIAKDNQVIWEYKVPYSIASDISVLENGNILFACSGGLVREITRDKETVWEYTLDDFPKEYKRDHLQWQSCQRLDDGTSLISSCVDKALLIINKDKEIVKKIDVIIKGDTDGRTHGIIQRARMGSNGLIYVGEFFGVGVYDSKTGKKTLHIPLENRCYQAELMNDGNIIATADKKLTIFDHQGNVKWQVLPEELPSSQAFEGTGFCPQKNGNIVVCNTRSYHSKKTDTPDRHPLLEITRKKEIVWSQPPRLDSKILECIRSVVVLDEGRMN